MTILSAIAVIVRDEIGDCQPVVRWVCESGFQAFPYLRSIDSLFRPPI